MELKFLDTCVGISQKQWDIYMENAKEINTRRYLTALKEQVGEWGIKDLENGYAELLRNGDILIFVHSGIEHFYKIN